MKKIIFLLLLSQAVLSQTVEFIEKNDTLQRPKYQQFIFLNDSTDLSAAIKVATIKATGNLRNPVKMLAKIKSESQKLGANSYKFVSFRKNALAAELTVTAYFITDSIHGVNYWNIPQNKVYIFGDDDLSVTKTQSYKIDGEKHEIGTGEYKVFNLYNGKELKISKGGFTGMTLWVKGEQGKSRFLSFSGVGIAGAQHVISSSGQGVGVNFTTGKIHHMDHDSALLLIKIFTEKK